MTTLAEIGNVNGSSSAAARWATFGPYFAMFPINFAFQIVSEYSKVGDYVIDPFAGRFSAVFAGALLGRNSVGIEINPVGWLYGRSKSNPAAEGDVLARLAAIHKLSDNYSDEVSNQKEFFRYCFCGEVLKFLLAARDHLDWKNRKTDATLMSLILVNLHGKLGEGLSNQMRQTKAMAPNYSVEWWKSNGLSRPPEIDPLEFLSNKIRWRYKKGTPILSAQCRVLLGDSTSRMPEIVRDARRRDLKYSLMFTSPPYQSVVDYHSDQWLRIWMLGLEKPREKYTRRFDSKVDYERLLDKVFGQAAQIMAEKSTVYVRTDVRPFTLETTSRILRKHFPRHSFQTIDSIVSGRSQTELFNNVSLRKEVDIVLTR